VEDVMNGSLELFGPDWSRGPSAGGRIETAALQIATTLAQLRTPLSRADSDLTGHADFIRQLADRLAPDWAVQIAIDVGTESANTIMTSIRAATGTYSVLDCWLSDSVGGGLTLTTPGAVSFNGGVVLETIVANKRYLIITPSTGTVEVTVTYTGTKSWYWAVSRFARAYYSSQLYFS
jgi:hypothetical protein